MGACSSQPTIGELWPPLTSSQPILGGLEKSIILSIVFAIGYLVTKQLPTNSIKSRTTSLLPKDAAYDIHRTFYLSAHIRFR